MVIWLYSNLWPVLTAGVGINGKKHEGSKIDTVSMLESFYLPKSDDLISVFNALKTFLGNSRSTH